MLEIRQLAIWHEQRAVLRNVNLRAERSNPLFVVGPGGSGKSSLLSALHLDNRPRGMTVSGDITLGGTDLSSRAPRIVHVPQHCAVDGDVSLGLRLADMLACRLHEIEGWTARKNLHVPMSLLLKPASSAPRGLRRALGVMAALEQEAELYLLDEPTAGIDDSALEAVRARLRTVAQRAMLVMATHNRRDCLTLGGHTALLAGGRVQEFAPSNQLFTQPVSTAARTYVATGNCTVPVPQPQAHADGLWWAVPRLLCGMSRPGLMANRQMQFQRLAEEGVSQLVCLEERCAYDTPPLRELGIAHYHFPVADMGVPTFSQAVDICRLTEPQIYANKGVALHCRGGLGRTGTMLAALLVWHGDTADVAINRVRTAQSHAIQNDVQLGFVHDFAGRISAWQ